MSLAFGFSSESFVQYTVSRTTGLVSVIHDYSENRIFFRFVEFDVNIRSNARASITRLYRLYCDTAL